MKILDESCYDLIVSNAIVPIYANDDNITYIDEWHALIHPPTADNIYSLGAMPYHIFPSLFEATSPISLGASGITSIQGNPHLDLQGLGVLVDIIDTGIGYTHPASRSPDSTSRIISIWDQTNQSDTPPERFTFGTEYQTEEINHASSSDIPHSTVPVSDPTGHDISLVSIIAGSPNDAVNFSGVAPKSELIIVKLGEAKGNIENIFCVPNDVTCYMESGIMLGVRYLCTVSQALRYPAVICLALGSSQGGHDGNGALGSYLDYLSRLPWIGVSISTGNEGVAGRHYFHTTMTAPFQDDFELLVEDSDHEFSFEIWSSYSRLSVEVSAPNHETTQQVFPSLFDCRRFQFVFHDCILWVNSMMFGQGTEDQLILVHFHNAFPGTWTIRIRNLENETFTFHAWLLAESTLSDNTYLIRPDPDTTITSPDNSYHSLTMTAYNQPGNRIIQESGGGFARNGYVKPDLAAPGYQIPCALPQNRYGDASGSGTAAAFTGGAIAIVLEWCASRGNYTSITGSDISRLLTRGARHDPEILFPNNIWGYEELDVSRVFGQFTSL